MLHCFFNSLKPKIASCYHALPFQHFLTPQCFHESLRPKIVPHGGGSHLLCYLLRLLGGISSLHLSHPLEIKPILIDECDLILHWEEFPRCISVILFEGRIYIDGCDLILHWWGFTMHLCRLFREEDLHRWPSFIFGETKFPLGINLAFFVGG